MESKITLNYKYKGCEEYAPVDASFEIPGDVTITQLLYQIENFMKACGYVFSGRLDLVEDTYEEFLDEISEDQTIWPSDYDGWENEPEGGCMADWDKATITSEEERAIRGKASLRADELKEMNERWNKLSNEEKANCLDKANKMSGL